MPPATLPPGLEHKYAEINGIQMHYVEAGAGDEVILFMHGFPESWYSWRHQLAFFAPSYRVVAPDQRGYNLSEAAGPYDTDTLQEDILALIRHLGVEKVHLVAHDWGAIVAWLIGIHHPEVLHSLTICNVPHPAVFAKKVGRNPRQWLRSWYIVFFQLPWLPEKMLARQGYHGLARMIIRDTRPGTFTRDDVKEMLEGWRRQGLSAPISWYRAAVRQRKPLPEPVPVIEVPTIVVWGEDDVALGKELTYGTEEFVHDLQIHYLPNTSHWVQQEEPAEVNRHIAELLERARPRA
ncbi:MAG: alpha/beta hydrolase [Dehalococcoidia bacterium]|nr:alpha/beta hydrolase [Dehalococcoidia bacterium]